MELFRSFKRYIFLKSLVGFCSFTGYDAISVFAGWQEVESLKLILRDIWYVLTFAPNERKSQNKNRNILLPSRYIENKWINCLDGRRVIQYTKYNVECIVDMREKLHGINCQPALMLWSQIKSGAVSDWS